MIWNHYQKLFQILLMICYIDKYEIDEDMVISLIQIIGTVNDISFLFSSPNEYNSYNGIRLPHILKKELALIKKSYKNF